jgi:hypothetical protein
VRGASLNTLTFLELYCCRALPCRLAAIDILGFTYSHPGGFGGTDTDLAGARSAKDLEGLAGQGRGREKIDTAVGIYHCLSAGAIRRSLQSP